MKWIKIKNKRVWSLISLIMCVWQLISVSEAGAVFCLLYTSDAADE